MYEVFINNKRLVFNTPDTIKNYNRSWKKIQADKAFFDKEITHAISDGKTTRQIVVFSARPHDLWKLFFKDHQLIKAAGGVVRNNRGQILFIYRNKKWDLPKGKVEKGEKLKDAALREVKEETGIAKLKLIKPLAHTFHVYTLNKKQILKKTYWYEMTGAHRKKFIPQLTEGITQVRWMDDQEVSIALQNSYPLIAGLISKFILDISGHGRKN